MIVALPGLFSYLFYSSDRSKAVVPVLVLLFVCFVVYSTRLFVLCLTLFTPGWSPAYLFEVVFVKCVCI